ncbi:MAG: c-type cytochrome [Casimicrobiaceae bacterium]|nr:c-type cytochrome [Casimicrobiaceae bacterium]MCX8098932.1 c-type cytochrome [Casimicrobiaceae bacterium]MDW8312631.1 c-type cytochrome [Burkholderiales bacterium]
MQSNVVRTAKLAVGLAVGMGVIATASAQAPSASAAPMSPTAVRDLASTCANCHGTNGRSVAEVASLAGQPAAAMAQKMRAFKAGQLQATIMHQLARGLTDQQIDALAAYFEKLPAR